jgi:hypothetical protein
LALDPKPSDIREVKYQPMLSSHMTSNNQETTKRPVHEPESDEFENDDRSSLERLADLTRRVLRVPKKEAARPGTTR